MRTGMIAFVICAAAAATALARGEAAPTVALNELPVNQWVTVYDGPAVTGYMNRIHWVPDLEAGLLWPADISRGANPLALAHFRTKEGRWVATPGSLPSGYELHLPRGYGIARSPSSSVYLPGLKKLLILQAPLMPSKKSATSWFVAPGGGEWEPVSDVRMSHRASEFNTSRGLAGLPVPLWGALCYDAHNREAVAVGGGGTWGRVGKQLEKVGPGDWVYDEKLKRVRRLTPDDRGTVTEAHKWYPGTCGTWTFSESNRQWRLIEQPLAEQPSGRWFPGAAYDAVAKRIVLFGGDNDARVLGDTWLYDSETRTWREAEPQASPSPRAGHGMVYLPDQRAVLLVGGYGGGWRPRKDVWIYRTAENRWRPLDLDLPGPATQCSAAYDPKTKTVLVLALSARGSTRKNVVYSLRLDLATAPKAAPDEDVRSPYHCKNYYHRPQVTPLPGEWLTGKGAPEAERDVRRRLASLPANTWTLLKPPRKAPARVWGRHAYDKRTHTGFANGGAHFGYNGSEFSEFSLLTNRWRGMADPTTYRPRWLHGSAGAHPGTNFFGWTNLATHTCQSLGVDPVSNSVINYTGDVYSLTHHIVIACIGATPGRSQAYQTSYVTTPHGLYAYGTRGLYKANVAAGGWDKIAAVIPDSKARHGQYNHLCYDSKRDQLIYFAFRGADVWTFDLKAGTWSQEHPVGNRPEYAVPAGDYVPEMDAVLLVFADGKNKFDPDTIHFYKVGEKKWYTAPYLGDKKGAYWTLNNTTAYDPELNLAVRMVMGGREAGIEVLVMRLVPERLTLTQMGTN